MFLFSTACYRNINSSAQNIECKSVFLDIIEPLVTERSSFYRKRYFRIICIGKCINTVV